MDDSARFQRLAALTTILAGVCFSASGVVLFAALNFNLNLVVFSDKLISIGPRGADC